MSNRGDDVDNSDVFILPGVGAFETAMKNLNHLGLTDKIKNQVLIKKKFRYMPWYAIICRLF